MLISNLNLDRFRIKPAPYSRPQGETCLQSFYWGALPSLGDKSIQIRTLFPFYLRRITVVIEKLKKAFSEEIMVRIPIENINLSLLFNDIKHVSNGQMN